MTEELPTVEIERTFIDPKPKPKQDAPTEQPEPERKRVVDRPWMLQ